MAGGLFALLDDVAALAKLAAASLDDVGAAAAKASSKAAGVVIDDAAVTPQYVQGLAASREVPIVASIAKGSIRNKLLIILPAALLLSEFASWLLTPILMCGGTYLAFEGAHKVWEKLRHRDQETSASDLVDDARTAPDEKKIIGGAVRTDLILSAEIMVIALNEVADQAFWSRLVVLFVVAVAMTVVVYGAVALIVKADDFGLMLAQKARTSAARRFGLGLVRSMPAVMATISAVGTVAMLWVGGHILLVGVDELGWHWPYSLVHDLQHEVEHAVPFAVGAFGWLTNTACSAVVGLLVGAVVVTLLNVLGVGHGAHADADAHEGADLTADDAAGDQH
ncbi:DUF808 domain-containing protein [Nocardioides yefusunii]|uniref:DUF808 domain-containing protein n=1 Tax=Nocardioides yefusunii TaxID=2500546 RepID=A0ABW1R1J8_9ACTN|nr:DUF808 domain-containing protein [Nocardioides yefusunii]